MKLREQKKLGILFLVLGAALILVGLLTDVSEKMNWLSSFGSAIAAVGAVRLLRACRLSRDPERAADYDASLSARHMWRTRRAAWRSISASMFSSPPRWQQF